jgi:hypothetical protein
MNHAATIVAKDDETVQHAERDGGHSEKVDADQVGRVIIE